MTIKHQLDYDYAMSILNPAYGLKYRQAGRRIKRRFIKRRTLVDLPVEELLTLDLTKLNAYEASVISKKLSWALSDPAGDISVPALLLALSTIRNAQNAIKAGKVVKKSKWIHFDKPKERLYNIKAVQKWNLTESETLND